MGGRSNSARASVRFISISPEWPGYRGTKSSRVSGLLGPCEVL